MKLIFTLFLDNITSSQYQEFIQAFLNVLLAVSQKIFSDISTDDTT